MSGPGDAPDVPFGLPYQTPEPEDVYESRDGLADSVLGPAPTAPRQDDALWSLLLDEQVRDLREGLTRAESLAALAAGTGSGPAAAHLARGIRKLLDDVATVVARRAAPNTAPSLEGRHDHPNPERNPS